MTDATGNVVRRYDYTPYGEELWAGTGSRTTAMGYQSAPDGFNPKFTGQHRDTENFLDYFHARYYSPQQGRFVSVDPENAGADVMNPQTWNGYAYVGNNPLNVTDPSGESWVTALFGAIGFIGGVLTAQPWEIAWAVGIMTGAEAAGAQYSFEKAVNSGNIAAIAGMFIGGLNTLPDYGSQFIIFDATRWKNGRVELPNGDVAIYGHLGQGAPILKDAGDRAGHDVGCVVPFMAGPTGAATAVTGQRITDASRVMIPKSDAGGRILGSTESTSYAAQWARQNMRVKLPFRVPSPMGTPGVDFRWAMTNKTGALAGRLAPYVGSALKYGGYAAIGVGSVMTWRCLSQE